MKALTISTLGLGLLFTGPLAAGELAGFTTSLFSGAGNCAFCHDPWTPGAADSGAVLASDWRATMMGHSFRDPVWRAVVEHEAGDHPKLKAFIEDKCQTCHAPLARTQARFEGTHQLAFASALGSPLAGEGVGCTLCHQIQNTNLGTHASFTGQYRIGTNRVIFGPYEKVLTMPMMRHVDYTPIHGSHVQDSALCATCHTLFTPVLDAAGKPAGEFPEQVPYLEWSRSQYARQGKHCQDCHMPRLDTAVKVSSRPPWLEGRTPFWKHQFVGGNAFMLELLAGHAKPLDANADPRQLRSMAGHARAQLRRAAHLQVHGRSEGENVVVRVTVENLTGHKFPTGHPFRRAWLHVSVRDARGKVVFESGAPEKSGAIRGLRDGYAPHYDVITRPDQVQIYQAVMADSHGAATWSLLRGVTYLKDNRIPPRGFGKESTPREVAVCGGAENDPNFDAGGDGRDEVTYRVTLKNPAQPLTARVELLYQSIPPETVGHLLRSANPAAKTFTKLFQGRRTVPEVAQLQEVNL